MMPYHNTPLELHKLQALLVANPNRIRKHNKQQTHKKAIPSYISRLIQSQLIYMPQNPRQATKNKQEKLL